MLFVLLHKAITNHYVGVHETAGSVLISCGDCPSGEASGARNKTVPL